MVWTTWAKPSSKLSPAGTAQVPCGKDTAYHRVMPRTDIGSRIIDVPPDKVYAALIDPGALLAWLPPAGMTGKFERFDPRPGGSYRMVLTYDDPSASRGKTRANSDVVEARFVDIDPGVRIVQAVDFVSDDPAYSGTMTMTWDLTAADGGTRRRHHRR